MNIDIKKELRNIIINDTIISKSFNKKHHNTKYSLDTIINEIFYML